MKTTTTKTTKTHKRAAITPDDLRATLLEAETTLAAWRNAHMPSDVRTLTDFAEVAGELLTYDGDATVTRDILERSIAEALPGAQAALERLNKKPPADSLFALEPPTIAPEFVDILEMHARQHLYDWLRATAPLEVFELYRLMGSLEVYNDDIERYGGQATRDGNSSIAVTVTGCINAIAATGGVFDGGGMRSRPRTQEAQP